MRIQLSCASALLLLAACSSNTNTNPDASDGSNGSDGAPSDTSQINDVTRPTDAPNNLDVVDAGAMDVPRGTDVIVMNDTGTPDTSTPRDVQNPTDTGTGQNTGQWVLGYYVGYDIHDLPIAQIDWSGLTHIAFSPMTVNDDLSLNLTFDDENGTGTQDAMAISSGAHAHGVKALLMLGGEGAGGNVARAASDANRAAFVSALLNALDTLGYDGIDLDWEDNVNLDDLVSLAADLRTARPGIILSYPAGCLNSNFDTVDPRLAQLAQSLDRFMVQTYYPSTAFAGSGWDSWFLAPVSGVRGSTPIAIDDTLMRYEAAGIPRAKLGMGTAFYAICYTGGITAPRQPTDGTSQQIVGGDNSYPLSMFFAGNSTYATSASSARQRDNTAQEPYLSLANPVNDPGCGDRTQYISYEDETSIIAKGMYSRAQGYGGIIVWTINEGWLPAGAAEGRAPNALMQALRTGFIAP